MSDYIILLHIITFIVSKGVEHNVISYVTNMRVVIYLSLMCLFCEY
jgi:hypothetical protein